MCNLDNHCIFQKHTSVKKSLNSQNQEVDHTEYKEQLLWEYDENLYYHQRQKFLFVQQILSLLASSTIASNCALVQPFGSSFQSWSFLNWLKTQWIAIVSYSKIFCFKCLLKWHNPFDKVSLNIVWCHTYKLLPIHSNQMWKTNLCFDRSLFSFLTEHWSRFFFEKHKLFPKILKKN